MAQTFIGTLFPDRRGVIRIVHRETGDRYHLVAQPNGSYRCHCNESFQVTRPDRRSAVRWVQQEARIASR